MAGVAEERSACMEGECVANGVYNKGMLRVQVGRKTAGVHT